MKISHIECSNIKSFKNLSTDLIDFNVIIGLNGSGKSNFILIFKIIKDILSSSLEQALNNQGGIAQLSNYFSQAEDRTIHLNFALQLASELETSLNIRGNEYRARIEKIDCDFKFNSNDQNSINIISEELNLAIEYLDPSCDIAKSFLNITRNSGGINIVLNNHHKEAIHNDNKHNEQSNNYTLDDLFPNIELLKSRNLLSSDLIIHQVFSDLFNIDIRTSAAQQISIYEFEQDLLAAIKFNPLIKDEKETSDQYTELLCKVLNDPNSRRQYFNLLNYVLPDIEDVKVLPDGISGQSIVVKERYHTSYIPAHLLSNGTLFLMIIILSLYFDNKYLTIFDEPERTIHPNVISKIVDMMKDVSNFKQIILSTHNAEIVKNSGIENILLISRDQEGYSQLSHPTNRIDIATFLENDIGLDELFVQNML